MIRNLKMASPCFRRMPTELVENWAQYLECPDLCSFRLVCRQTHAQTLHVVRQRLFTTWKTSLMDSDIEKLEDISSNTHLRNYVKNICIQDDCERMDAQATLTTLYVKQLNRTPHVWPRNDAHFVKENEIGVSSLKTMCIDGRLRPETIKIRDYRIGNASSSTEPASTLATNILDGANLAAVSIKIQRKSQSVVEAAIQLSPQHQGQDVAFSMLESAELCFATASRSFWSEQVLYNAPILENLKISIERPWNEEGDSMFSTGVPVSKLRSIDILMSTLPAHNILMLIANSKQSLTSFSFSLMRLSRGSAWRDLLTRIGSDFPALNFFNLKFLSEEGFRTIQFQELSKEHIERDYGPGLEIFERGPQGNRRVTWVRYTGPSGSSVLDLVARSATRS
ncbi:hypothetical protein BKA66DRAFT_555102 [Pyrenochaeta sp. MPI-SDFR-AT-0127]|nr:hypothetical protein BKA66DRAFT_555102 [Pyrenochaeta sp. MPI-SDFR-AT-0127]